MLTHSAATHISSHGSIIQHDIDIRGLCYILKHLMKEAINYLTTHLSKMWNVKLSWSYLLASFISEKFLNCEAETFSDS